ncbi:XRE family transcriptional regulator [Nonomuraea glycinis]|uniref:Transcriptional regulator n=1 Tax=Nonomuraea glycinis TaxID=2047744 RepID=A0A918A2Y9_9ACTN|nr:XRE family transcriptional regulator [Nonomuraea glycinis]MCA2180287.1 XRE family transcriptional regulator [Nonomuraea glycinis]GGP03919.1 transcriptional regulator [Nonomuraea glycinis]
MPGETTKRIQRLITESALTQTEFAARAGLDASKFSKSMSGVRRFTSLDLARIAEVGGVTVDWLLGIDRPAPALAARTRGSTTSEQEAVAEAERLAQFWADLTFLGYEQPRVALAALPPRGRCIDQGRELAESALRLAKSQNVEPWQKRDLAPLVEDLFGIDVRIMRFSAGYEGLSWSDDACKLVIVGTSDIPARQRFTIAHELGHLIAGDDQGLHLDPNLSDAAHRKNPSEIRANAFATEFLLPREVLKEKARERDWSDRSFAELACDLYVSPVNLAWRLFNLDLIDSEQCARFRAISALQAATLADRLESHWAWIASAGQPRISVPLVRTAFQAYQQGDTTLRPLANLLRVDTAHLRQAMDGAREESPLSS